MKSLVAEKDAGKGVVWAVGPCVAAKVQGDEIILHVALTMQRRSAVPGCPHERKAIPLPHGVSGRDVARLCVGPDVVTLGTVGGDLFYVDLRNGRWWGFGCLLQDAR